MQVRSVAQDLDARQLQRRHIFAATAAAAVAAIAAAAAAAAAAVLAVTG